MVRVTQCVQSRQAKRVWQVQLGYAVISADHGVKLTKAFAELLASLAYPALLNKGFYDH